MEFATSSIQGIKRKAKHLLVLTLTAKAKMPKQKIYPSIFRFHNIFNTKQYIPVKQIRIKTTPEKARKPFKQENFWISKLKTLYSGGLKN